LVQLEEMMNLMVARVFEIQHRLAREENLNPGEKQRDEKDSEIEAKIVELATGENLWSWCLRIAFSFLDFKVKSDCQVTLTSLETYPYLT